jgi:hypothetical protein
MIIGLISFAFAQTTSPTATPADQISAEEAYRLAAEANGRVAALERRYRALKVGDPKVAAELAALEKRVHDLECNAGSDDPTCPERPAAIITVTPIDVPPAPPDDFAEETEEIGEELDVLEVDLSRLEALEEREATLVTGIGVQGGVQPPIPGIEGPVWLGVSLTAETCHEDAYGGFCLGGTGSLGSERTYGLAGEYVRFKKGPNGRFAWGYGALAGADFVGGLGAAQYSAYHGAIGAQTYLRFTLWERTKNEHRQATELVVAPIFTVGQVGVPGAAAFEARAGLRIYIQRSTGVGGKVAE